MIDDLIGLLVEFGIKKSVEVIKNKDFKEDNMFDYVIKCPECAYKQNVNNEGIVLKCADCNEYIFINKNKNISFCNECGKIFNKHILCCDECEGKTNIYERENLRYCEQCKVLFVSKNLIKKRACPQCKGKISRKVNIGKDNIR